MKTMNKVALSLAILMSPFFASASEAEVEELEVTSVEVIDVHTLEVVFNNDIDFSQTESFEFSLVNTEDEEAEDLGGFATYSEGSTSQSVLFDLGDEEMLPNTAYELRVEYVFDVDGNTVTADVNSTFDVNTPEVFPVVEEDSAEDAAEYDEEADEDWLNAGSEEDSEADADINEALNAAGDEDAEADEDAEVPTLDAGGLPQTGPQEMLLVLVALLVAAGVVYARRRA